MSAGDAVRGGALHVCEARKRRGRYKFNNNSFEAYIGRNTLAPGKERENLQDVLTRFEAQQRRQKRCLAMIGGCCVVTVSSPSMPKLWQGISRICCALTCSILLTLSSDHVVIKHVPCKNDKLESLMDMQNIESCLAPTCSTCDAPFPMQTVQCLCFVCFS